MFGNDIKDWAECNKHTIWIDEMPWVIRNKMLLPLSMPHSTSRISKGKVREALRSSNAILAHWTDEWDRSESQWWWICCDDKNYDVERIQSSNGRRAVRKGLNHCDVRRVEAKMFSTLAYPIYKKSLLSYRVKSSMIPTQEQYNKSILEQSCYQGFELWGAFIGGKLAAFSTCIVLDNAVNLGSTKSDPDFHKYNPNNSLFYQITKYYLQERGVLYITNGYRTLLHDTTINDFLIRMGYRRIYGRLNVELSNRVSIFNKSGILDLIKKFKLFTRLAPTHMAKLSALQKLITISNSFEK